MTLPTVTTVSEIGINLAQFRNSEEQPLLAGDTLNFSCFTPLLPSGAPMAPQGYLFLGLPKKTLLSGRKNGSSRFSAWHSEIISLVAPLFLG